MHIFEYFLLALLRICACFLQANVVNLGLMASAWRSVRRGGGGVSIDGTAHIVGAAVGFAAYHWMRSNWEGPSRSRSESF